MMMMMMMTLMIIIPVLAQYLMQNVFTHELTSTTNLSLYLFNYEPCHEGIWWSGDIAPPFSISALGGGEWSASRPGRFTPRKIVPYIHWIKYWVGHRACLDTVEKREVLPMPGTETRPFQLVTRRYTD
jgi:hypothetical protein